LADALCAMAGTKSEESITPDMIDQAANIAGVSISPHQKQALLSKLNEQRRGYDTIRKLRLANDMPPAFRFDPVINPRFALATESAPVRSRDFSSSGTKIRYGPKCIPAQSDILWVMMEPDIARVAAMVSDPARARILWTLADGRGLPAGELARRAGVTPQTASSHLAMLTRGGFLLMIPQGRHRYYRLTNSRVAHLLESMAAFAPELPKEEGSRCGPELRQARSCYHHLGGHLAVVMTQAFIDHRWLLEDGLSYHLTDFGETRFTDLGIDLARLERSGKILARPCLDWSERRNHLAGELGRAVADCLFENRWILRIGSSRALKLTDLGKDELRRLLDLVWAD
jgi:DNA-binding transcriptional ArsR family regulator